MRIIGDVHGHIEEYNKLCSECEYSVQLGDMGFQGDYAKINVDPTRHIFFKGNHDQYGLTDPANCLGDFGHHFLGKTDFFWVCGGRTLDKYRRIEGVNWFPEEELNWNQCRRCLNYYGWIKPDLVITHECPYQLLTPLQDFKNELYGGDPWPNIESSNTAKLLGEMFDFHQPKVWIFGHHHVDWEFTMGNTNFRCLGELSYMDIP